MRIAVLCLVCVLAARVLAGDPQQTGASRAVGGPGSYVDRFLDADHQPLVSYRAVRRLEAAARAGRMRASLTAMTSLDPDRGFQFEILEETGSSVIRSKVLRAALEGERRMRNSGESARNALTRLNYEFGDAQITEHGLVRVGIRPRRTDAPLVVGSILLTEDAADLVSIEGRLVKRPSFWTRRVDIVRRYARLARVRVPISMESTADVLLGGRSTFSMRYDYQSINAEPLSAGGTR
jgi:hypothetical protein